MALPALTIVRTTQSYRPAVHCETSIDGRRNYLISGGSVLCWNGVRNIVGVQSHWLSYKYCSSPIRTLDARLDSLVSILTSSITSLYPVHTQYTMQAVKTLLTGDNTADNTDFDVEAVLSTLTMAEKISLLGGKVSLDQFGGLPCWASNPFLSSSIRISGTLSISLRRVSLPFECLMDPTEFEVSNSSTGLPRTASLALLA
jgi:hypothetical protein